MRRTIGLALVLIATAIPARAEDAMQHGMNHGQHLGADVMPFDLARTLHIFTPLEDGGLQEIVSRDGDPAQIELIRQHLRKEAAAFSKGDFSDPARIHGMAMPGLKELEAAGGKIEVDYADTQKGARLRYRSDDPATVDALHAWFRAQVRDHGADAVMGQP